MQWICKMHMLHSPPLIAFRSNGLEKKAMMCISQRLTSHKCISLVKAMMCISQRLTPLWDASHKGCASHKGSTRRRAKEGDDVYLSSPCGGDDVHLTKGPQISQRLFALQMCEADVRLQRRTRCAEARLALIACGVATMSRRLKMIGLFCKRAL